MSIGIGTIGPFADRNIAGCCRIDLVDITDVDAVPEEVDCNVPTAVTLLSGKVWTTITPTGLTLSFTEKLLADGSVEALAEMVIPKDRVALLRHLYGLHRMRVLSIVHTLNPDDNVAGEEQRLLMGNKQQPAKALLVTRATGSDPTSQDRNEVVLQVSWVRDAPTPFYLGEPPEVAVPGVCETLEELMAPEDGADLWALMSPTQQAAALVAAGIVAFDGIIDDGPPYTESLIDP